MIFNDSVIIKIFLTINDRNNSTTRISKKIKTTYAYTSKVINHLLIINLIKKVSSNKREHVLELTEEGLVIQKAYQKILNSFKKGESI